jgi:hypothetical protein
MGLHSTERWKLRQIEEALRADAPGLDALLARGPAPRRTALHAPAAGVLAGYIVPAALVLAGLVLDITWLVAAGVVACPFIPVITLLLIRRHVIRGWTRHSHEP